MTKEETTYNENRTSIWVFDNIGETTIDSIKGKRIASEATILATKILEKGGFSVTMKGAKAIEVMCNLRYWFAKNKIRIHILKT